MTQEPSQLSNLQSLAIGLRFLARVPSYLRHRITLDEAQALQRHNLEHRETRFLDLAKRAIYDQPRSPLRRLLLAVGCEYGDLEALVRGDGLDAALATLLERGVYVSVDEFKGRKPITRGSTSFHVSPTELRNPIAAFHVAARSGGSRSQSTPFLIDLAYVRACAAATMLHLESRGGLGWEKCTWETPGAGARFRLLMFAMFGEPPHAWFTQVDPAMRGLDPVFRWSDRALRWASRLTGISIPRPVLATLEDPLPVVRWVRRKLGEGCEPLLYTFPSSALRMVTAAAQAGIDLRGAHCTLLGEPTTAARLERFREAGIDAVPRYGTIECGPIAYGCLRGEVSDEMHLVRDLHALVKAGSAADAIGVPPDALFITNLHPSAPFPMLNFSMGDRADFKERGCGCPLEPLGWKPHLSNVRSYEKLTAGGMTFFDTDVIRVLEEVLPDRFGGAPADYQLVEEETQAGHPVLKLLVHPRVGEVDEASLARTFLEAMGAGSSLERIMTSVLRDGVALRVERRPPFTTRSSKILHLHVQRTDGG
jgi:hypothetical protein